jgi:hypothetical protein
MIFSQRDLIGFILNFRIYKLVMVCFLSVSLCAACGSLWNSNKPKAPKASEQVQAKYSHTELSVGKHYLAYSGELAMTLEIANEKWLAKAEKLCKSREFEYEIEKQEFRGKDFSEYKYPYIEGKLFCNKPQ